MCESQSPQHTPYFHPKEMEDRPYGNGIVDGHMQEAGCAYRGDFLMPQEKVSANQCFDGANGNHVPQLHRDETVQGACKVCQDKASGNHYGVLSCEGCKGFFRRSVNGRKTYKCPKNNDCVVVRGKGPRKRCMSCRFNMCVKQGMQETGVRVGIKNKKTLPPEPNEDQPTTGCLTAAMVHEESISEPQSGTSSKKDQPATGCLTAAMVHEESISDPQSGAVMDPGRRAVEVPQRSFCVQDQIFGVIILPDGYGYLREGDRDYTVLN